MYNSLYPIIQEYVQGPGLSGSAAVAGQPDHSHRLERLQQSQAAQNSRPRHESRHSGRVTPVRSSY